MSNLKLFSILALIIIIVGFLGIIAVLFFTQEERHPDPVTGNLQQFLGTHELQKGVVIGTYDHAVMSPDGAIIAYTYGIVDDEAAGVEINTFLAIGPKTFGPYEKIGRPVFSSDSSAVAFVVSYGANDQVVTIRGIKNQQHNVIEGPSYTYVSTPVFSSQNENIYAALENDKYFVSNGTQRWGQFDAAQINPADAGANNHNAVVVDPTGQRVAYVVNQGEKKVVVTEDLQGRQIRGEPFDSISSLTLNPSTGRPAYQAFVDDKSLVVDGTTKGKLYDNIAGFNFPRYRTTAAYRGATKVDDSVSFSLIGANSEVPSKEVFRECFSFDKKLAVSPDGKLLAVPYNSCPSLGEPKDWVTVKNLQGDSFSSAEYSQVSSPLFSPDGQYVGFVAQTDDGTLHWITHQTALIK